jgi:hypothetical protein
VLKGIECSLTTDEVDGARILSLKLLDSSLQDIFHRLCLDIVTSAADALTEAEVVARTISRTWRWHHLLRGGGDSRLSVEEQKGLIGELIVLDKFMLPSLVARDAISSWHGPLGAPKDFEIARIALEAKARRGSATPYIAISSEYQLDRNGTDVFFLHVSELNSALPESECAFTLTTLSERVQSIVREKDPAAADAFESLLAAAGFRWEDDYSDSFWVHGPGRSYQVTDNFPSITPERFRAGVSKVRYSVALTECEPFRVMDDVILMQLSGGQNGD